MSKSNESIVLGAKGKRSIIYGKLLSDIQTGTYKAGDLLPTELDLADQFRVSRSTINRTLSRLKDEGYLTRLAGYGTIVRSNTTKQSRKIGLLVPGLSNSEVFEPICKTISDKSFEYGFNIRWYEKNIADLHPDSIKEIDALCDQYIRDGIEGLLLSPVSRVSNMHRINQSIVDRFSQKGIQVVLIDRDFEVWPKRSSYDLVSMDNIHAGYSIAVHLLEQGCRKIAFLANPYMADPSRLRFIGAREAVYQKFNGNETIDFVVVQNELPRIVPNVINKNHPEAIICSTDTLAARVFQSCVSNSVSVPGDLLIAGVDDVNFASNMGVPLTSFKQPLEEIAANALRIMESRLENPKQNPKTVLIRGELSVRESTNRARVQ